MSTAAILFALGATFIIVGIIFSGGFDRELRNLIKINRLGERTNALLYRRQELEKILREFHEIKTHEHSDKKALYVMLISDLLNSKKI